MNLNFNLNLSQEQKLVMTQQMQLSLKLLQMSAYDLREYIEEEFEKNPVLDADFTLIQEKEIEKDRIDYKEMIKYLEFDKYDSKGIKENEYNKEEFSPLNFISKEKSLEEHLKEQLLEIKEGKDFKNIVSYLIDNLDSRGYLDLDMKTICNSLKISQDKCNLAISILQSFEPDGIGARNIKECLKIQLRKRKRLDGYLARIIDNYLDLIAENKYKELGKKINITPKEAQDYGDIIKTLEPKPSRGFYTGEETKFVIPDASIRKVDGQYFVIINDGVLPRLSISKKCKEILLLDHEDEVDKYIKEKLKSAMFLIKSIEQRKSTLQRILEKIIEKQKEYFDKGLKYLKPMTLKEIAEELNIHESTVSRAIKEKYVFTNMDTIKIKDLFTASVGLSNTGNEEVNIVNIKNKIRELIEKEDKSKPLSDKSICDELNKNSMNISRRTVAKYREELGLMSSSKRKRI